MAMRHEGIAQAAAFAVSDPRLGERLCLAVVPAGDRAPDPEAILDHLSAAGVSRYDMPEFILCLAEMPLTASGKIVKRELARWVAEGRVQPKPTCLESPTAAEG
jgi:acyl-CoA synthetase